MIYFMQHLESCNSEWTIYGCYSDNDIQPEGDVLCEVHMVQRESDKNHLEHDVIKEYIEPDEVRFITKKEYLAVMENFADSVRWQLQKVSAEKEKLSADTLRLLGGVRFWQ